MPSPLLLAIDWAALLKVAGVTILATVVIAGLMSLSNWFFTPAAGVEHVSRGRVAIGFILIGVMGLIILFGLYLMVAPRFHWPTFA